MIGFLAAVVAVPSAHAGVGDTSFIRRH